MRTKEKDSIGSILVILIPVIIAMIMVILDSTAVTLAIPSLVENFHSSNTTMQWVISGYTLAQAAVIPLSGWLSDRFGAKRIFLICLILFVMGSLLCSLSVSAPMIIICRILQGLGGGMIMPIAFALSYQVSPPNKVGIVTACVSIPAMLGPALGPILSGWILTVANWRYIFLINIPLGILAIILAVFKLPKFEGRPSNKIDIAGLILIPISFTALIIGINQSAYSWNSPMTICSVVIGLVMLAAFIYVELHTKNPLLDLRVFKSFNFSISMITSWFSTFVAFGSLFLVPIFLQQIEGFTSLQTALIMLPQAICNLVFAPIVGHLFDKVGLKPLVMCSVVFNVASMLLFANGVFNNTQLMFVIGCSLFGIGMALSQQYNTHLMQVAPQNLSNRVMSISSSSMQIFTSLAIAVFSTVIALNIKVNTSADVNIIETSKNAYRNVFYLTCIIAAVSFVLMLFIKRPKIAKAKPMDQKKV